jgi:hypothetical protein
MVLRQAGPRKSPTRAEGTNLGYCGEILQGPDIGLRPLS